MNPYRFPLMVVALAALGGCADLGNPLDAFKAKREGPDEFQVLAREELRLPPDLRPHSLPEPRPGTPSPREPDPRRAAEAALTGGAPRGDPPPSGRVSRGEEILLEAAEARAADPVGAEILGLAVAEAEAGQPYEPPTIFALFGGADPEIDPGLTLDAVAESERLQKAGIPAPSDPRVDVAGPEEAGSPPPRPAYARETPRGRPINTIEDQLGEAQD